MSGDLFKFRLDGYAGHTVSSLWARFTFIQPCSLTPRVYQMFARLAGTLAARCSCQGGRDCWKEPGLSCYMTSRSVTPLLLLMPVSAYDDHFSLLSFLHKPADVPLPVGGLPGPSPLCCHSALDPLGDSLPGVLLALPALMHEPPL